MNCPHCGSTLLENTAYCSNCGKLLPAYPPTSITTATPVFQDNVGQKLHRLNFKFKTIIAVAFAFYFVFSSFFIFHYVREENIKSDIETCSQEITFYLNSLDMNGLSQYITEESQQIISKKLYSDDSKAKEANEMIKELWEDFGEDAENPDLYIKIVKSALAQLNWVDFHIDLKSSNISIWQKKAIVHSEIAGKKIDLTFVKENGHWLLSLSEKDVEILKDHVSSVVKELK